MVVILLHKFFVEMLGVHIGPHVLSIDGNSGEAGSGPGQVHFAEDVPAQCRPQEGRVILIGIEVDFFEVSQFLAWNEGVQVDFEALLGCENRSVASEAKAQ